jgi:hypothetical protein
MPVNEATHCDLTALAEASKDHNKEDSGESDKWRNENSERGMKE